MCWISLIQFKKKIRNTWANKCFQWLSLLIQQTLKRAITLLKRVEKPWSKNVSKLLFLWCKLTNKLTIYYIKKSTSMKRPSIKEIQCTNQQLARISFHLLSKLSRSKCGLIFWGSGSFWHLKSRMILTVSTISILRSISKWKPMWLFWVIKTKVNLLQEWRCA
jgi:hypothetical protein